MLERGEGDVSDAAAGGEDVKGGDVTNAALELRKILVVLDEENGEEVSCSHRDTHILMHTQRYTHTQSHTQIHTYSCTHTDTHILMHTHRYTHTHTHKENGEEVSCTHTHTHTHTYIHILTHTHKRAHTSRSK